MANGQQSADMDEFHDSDSPQQEYKPEIPQQRKTTDFIFLIIFASLFGLLAILIIYCGTQSRLSLYTRGYDSCGNVCGEENPKVEKIECSGKDMKLFPFTQYISEIVETKEVAKNITHYECVADCKNHSKVFYNRCIPERRYAWSEELLYTLSQGSSALITQCIIGFGATLLMLVLFKFFTKIVLWFNLIGTWLCLVAFVIFFWVKYSKASPDDFIFTSYHGGILTIVAIALVFVILQVSEKMETILSLYTQSIKFVFSMPLLLLEPFLTVISLGLAILCSIYVHILISTSGYLTSIDNDQYGYKLNFVKIFATWLNFIALLWMCQFIIGCQHMVIAGSISSYYFVRNKAELTLPIFKSFYHLIRFHLGTAALGSLITSIVSIIKVLLSALLLIKWCRSIAFCSMDFIRTLLEQFTTTAYIQTARHGLNFFSSGGTAARLLIENDMIIVATNLLGCFVMWMLKFLIVFIVLFTGCVMEDESMILYWVIPLISCAITLIIAHVIFVMFESTVDILLVCYCEDKTMNDGATKPYYMPNDLSHCMDKAREQLEATDTYC